MKQEHTTQLLLGVIATGVAALTALAFEKRYLNSCRRAGDGMDDSVDHAYDRISRRTQEIGREVKHEAASFRDRLEDGMDHLREKAVGLKERVSDGLERAGSHLRDGAEKLKDGFKQGAEDIKDGAQEASDEAKRALSASKI